MPATTDWDNIVVDRRPGEQPLAFKGLGTKRNATTHDCVGRARQPGGFPRTITVHRYLYPLDIVGFLSLGPNFAGIQLGYRLRHTSSLERLDGVLWVTFMPVEELHTLR